MIGVKHPIELYNRQQNAAIDQLPGELQRYHELLFSYGNAAYRYHATAKEFHPTQIDYQEWLEGLPSHIAKDMKAKGFEECKTIVSFLRYVMEKNDIGMEAFVRDLMGDKEYQEYQILIAKK